MKTNSFGPWRCAPHIKGQAIRDDITKIITNLTDGEWFDPVYEYLTKNEVPPDFRDQFYDHARKTFDAIKILKGTA